MAGETPVNEVEFSHMNTKKTSPRIAEGSTVSADDFIILNIQENSSKYETKENPFTMASSSHLSNTSGEEKMGETTVAEKVNKMSPSLTNLHRKSVPPPDNKNKFSRSIIEAVPNQSSQAYYN